MNDKDLVQKVARLARLTIEPGELETTTKNFESVLGLFEKLKSIDTSEVEEFNHFPDSENVFRKDVVIHSLTTEQGLSNASDKEGNNFKTPLVVE